MVRSVGGCERVLGAGAGWLGSVVRCGGWVCAWMRWECAGRYLRGCARARRSCVRANRLKPCVNECSCRLRRRVGRPSLSCVGLAGMLEGRLVGAHEAGRAHLGAVICAWGMKYERAVVRVGGQNACVGSA